MRANVSLLLRVVASAETIAGLCLLVVPGLALVLLLGDEHKAAAETLLAGRIAGAALLSIGLIVWLTRTDTSQLVERGLVIGIAVYTVLAAVLLAYAGAVLKMAGIGLWPAFVFHAALAIWCFQCLSSRTAGRAQSHFQEE